MIIITAEMEDPVDGIADEFALPGGSKATRLDEGFVHANEDFAIEEIRPGRVRIIEGDHVG